MADIASLYAYTVDLNKPITKTILRDTFVTEDKEAHVFHISLEKGGESVNLSGAQVTGYFMRYKDRVSIPLTGTVDGNAAVLSLSQACYNYSTTFALTICVMLADVKHAVFVGEGQMYANRTDSIVDPEHIIPSVEDIIAQYALMKEGTNAANAAAGAANVAVSGANDAAARAASAAATATGAAERANTAAQAVENAPVPVSSTVTYQVGQSASTPPSGSWQNSVPSVPQGQFLWSRVVHTYTNGGPVTMYSVARQGVDGSGSVSSVNGVGPDANGNVDLGDIGGGTGTVQSVNGVSPDENGNVSIEVGAVNTVNGAQPDASGNVVIDLLGSYVHATLLASAWASGVQTVSITGVTAESGGDVGLDESISAEAFAAAAKAQLMKTGQGAGTITVKAFGEAPAVNIPIVVRVVN